MKKSIVKALAVLLILVITGGLLAGCGGEPPEPVAAAEPSGNTAEGSSAPAAADQAAVEPPAADAPSAVNESDSEPVSLRLIFYGDMTPRREEYFKKDFHDKVMEELNLDLTVETLSWGSNDTVATMLASGEDFAVYNIVSAFDWPGKGYLAEITMDQINANMPNFLDMRGTENGFECVKYNGKIYSIPIGNKAYSGFLQSFEVRNDILKEAGYEANDIKSYEQFMEALTAVKEKNPDLRIAQSFIKRALAGEFSKDELYFSLGDPDFVLVDELADDDKVYSHFESEYFAFMCRMAADWQERGFINEDLITNPTQGLADWNAGNCFMVYGGAGAVIDTALKTVAPEAELKLIDFSNMPRVKANDYDWGIGISAAGAAKAGHWLRLIDWIYASQENYDFCVYGVEGKDYEVTADGAINKLVTDTFWDSWFLQASKFHKFDPSLTQEQIQAYKDFDNGSILSKLAGFTFDSTGVAAELAAMSAVHEEYIVPMKAGLLDYDENIENVIERLKSAGIDKYMEEYQKQFSAFRAGK